MAGLLYAGRRLAEDMVSTLVFALIYAASGHLALAIGSGVLIGVGQLAWEIRAGRSVSAMQGVSLFLVAGFGAASLIADDPRIAMLKPTVIYAVIGLAMLKPGWINRYMSDRARELSGDVAYVFGFLWAALMLATAALNLLVSREANAATWAAFIAIFPVASKIALFAVHYLVQRSVARARLRRARSAAAPSNAEA
ncbi:septation protein IspZ [Pleomorphomonas koreensis]|uniref:septation protein IspZ n=1 Tax=Pleomorphomonas koreensis TaxID=257440 RepID=UPI00040DB01E|nr:septation protein IspZ [Pleomorphomonas koreensis]